MFVQKWLFIVQPLFYKCCCYAYGIHCNWCLTSVCKKSHSTLRVDSWVDSGHGGDAKSTVPVKVKLFLFVSCRHVLGSRGIALLIHDLSTKWKRVVRLMPQLLYPLGRNPSTHWVVGWVDADAGLDILEKRTNTCPCQHSDPRMSGP